MKQQCRKCKKNYNILCTDGNCFYCFTKEHGKAPNKEFGNKFTNKNK